MMDDKRGGGQGVWGMDRAQMRRWISNGWIDDVDAYVANGWGWDLGCLLRRTELTRIVV